MTERAQAAAGALQHGNAGLAQPSGPPLVQRAGHVGQQDHRLAGRGMGVQDRARVGLVAVVLLHEVDRQRHHRHCRVVGESRQARREQRARVRTSAPDIQRVVGRQARVEQTGKPFHRRIGERGERDAEPVRDIGHENPLGSGVVHSRYARTRDRPGAAVHDPATGGEQLEQVGHLVEVLDAQQAVSLDECLPDRIASGQGTRVRADERAAGGGAADAEEHDGHVTRRGAVQCRTQPRRLAHGLKQQRDDTGFVEVQCIVDVVRGRRDQFLARGDGQRVTDATVAAKQRGERRARVRHERDRPLGQVRPLEVADRAQSLGDVDETHAARAAQRHAGGPSSAGKPLTERRLAR